MESGILMPCPNKDLSVLHRYRPNHGPQLSEALTLYSGHSSDT
uniref:Uncharacterized protein n=1 Tax=Manihot esculenta TaxID=3983 RepID=A0A2C9UK96_MANES